MAQFSVFRNPGRDAAVPFAAQVQSGRPARSLGRVVVPLAPHEADGPGGHPLTPCMTVQSRLVHHNPPDVAAVLASRLGDPVKILAGADQDWIAKATDEMLTGPEKTRSSAGSTAPAARFRSIAGWQCGGLPTPPWPPSTAATA